MQKTRVQSLGWDHSPEKQTATHSSILGLGNPMDITVHGVAQSRTQLSNKHFLHFLSPYTASPGSQGRAPGNFKELIHVWERFIMGFVSVVLILVTFEA